MVWSALDIADAKLGMRQAIFNMSNICFWIRKGHEEDNKSDNVLVGSGYIVNSGTKMGH